MIRLLTFTNLYPSRGRPRHGIFVEQRLRRLVESGRVQAAVVVPVAQRPWEWRAPEEPLVRHGIAVRYCGFPSLRGVTTLLHPWLMARCALREVELLRSEGRDFDIIDAHFLYPDGVAAVHLAHELRRPVILTARGSDVNVALGERVAGRSIRWAVQRAAAVIAVSRELRDVMVCHGIDAERITVLRNGVDLELFAPGERDGARAMLGISGPTLLAVGNLVEEKGYDLVLAALVHLPEARLIVLGSGPLQARLRNMAEDLGLSERVRWVAPVPQEALRQYFIAADVAVLASTREGMPNVLLESLACGTPVVATAVGGAKEIVTDSVAGKLVHERSPEQLAAACRELLAERAEPAAVRRFGESFSWAAPVAAQLALLERVREGR